LPAIATAGEFVDVDLDLYDDVDVDEFPAQNSIPLRR